jgi:hypothetical protein
MTNGPLTADKLKFRTTGNGSTGTPEEGATIPFIADIVKIKPVLDEVMIQQIRMNPNP